MTKMTKNINCTIFMKDHVDEFREKFSTVSGVNSETIERFNSRPFKKGQYIEVKKVLFQPGDQGFRVTVPKRKKTRVWDIHLNQKLVHNVQNFIKDINDFDVILNEYIINGGMV